MDFRNDIQGLRALAVFLVFLFHLSIRWMPGGFIGVDIFFVISGYLVSSIIFHKISKNSFSLISFYESRIKRIVPAYLLFLLITALVVSFVFVRSDIVTFRKSLFWTLLFNSNNHFASLDSYFGTSSHENPLLHTWTLAVEMQFYLILPLVLILVKNKKTLVYLLSIASVILIGYSTNGIFNGKSSMMYFSLLSRMPEFLLGVIASVSALRDREFIRNNSKFLSPLGLIIIVFCAFYYNESLPFPGITALLPCLGTILILISSSNVVNNVLSNRTLVYIGEISYSIYLWHWPIMSIFRYYKNEYEFTSLEKVGVFIVTLMFSLISYYTVERSMRNIKGGKFYFPFMGLAGATASMVFFVLTINRKIFKDNEDFMYPSFGLSSHGHTFKNVELLGDTTNKKSDILLLGDSHALCMKMYFHILGERNKLLIKTVTNDRYPTLPGLTESDIKDEKLYKQYSKLIKHVENELPKSKLIIINFTGDGTDWIELIKKLMANLNDNQRILFIEDFPRVDKNPIRLNKDIVKNKSIDQKYEKIYKPISKEILDLIEGNVKTRYVKMGAKKVFEDAPFHKDTLMYYDRGHLNAYGATVYALNTEDNIMNSIKWGLNL